MSTNDEIDGKLLRLAIAAQDHKHNILERRKVLTELVTQIEGFRIVGRPRPNEFPPDIYEEIYAEAKQDLMLCIFTKIDTYNPSKGKVRQWLNFLMNKRFFNEAIPKIVGRKNSILYTEMQIKWEEYLKNDSYEAGTALREMIEEDADDALKSVVMTRNPQINFQVLLLKRGDGMSWQQLSEEFGVKLPTLTSFYRRSLPQFIPRFREYL
jgi:DNA-directed RNA polymerase specialized sigma24 family protein